MIVGSPAGSRMLGFFSFSFETVDLFLRLFNVLLWISLVQLDEPDEDVPP